MTGGQANLAKATAPPWGHYVRIGAGSIFVSGPASLTPIFAPLIVGALLAIENSPYTLTGVSLLISGEILVTALVSASTNYFVQAHSIRSVSVMMLALWALATLASAYLIAAPLAFLSARLLAGIFAGIALTASGTAVAASGDPDRTQSFAILLGTLIGAVSVAMLGATLDADGAKTGMLLLAFFGLIILPGALLLRADDRPSTAVPVQNPLTALKDVEPRLYLVLAGAFALAVSDAAVYVLMNPIGAHAGLGADEVAYILAIGIVLALLAAGIAAAIGTRFGRRLLLTVAIGVKLIATILLTLWADPMAFAILLSTTTFFYVLALPYIVGLATDTQPDGRGTVLNSVAMLLGGAAGPALGGWVGESFGFAAAGILAGLVGGAGLVALILATRQQADPQILPKR